MNPIIKCDIVFPALCVLGVFIAMFVIFVRNKKIPKTSVNFWETTRVKIPICIFFILIMSFWASLGIMDFYYKDYVVYQGEYSGFVRNKNPTFYFAQNGNEYLDKFYSRELNDKKIIAGETYRVTAGQRTKRMVKIEKIDKTTGKSIVILNFID